MLMSPRSFFSRFLSSGKAKRTLANSSANRRADDRCQQLKWRHYLLQFFIVMALLLSAVWLLMAICYQFGAYAPVTWLATTIIIGLLSALLSSYYLAQIFNPTMTNKQTAHKISVKADGNVDSNVNSNSKINAIHKHQHHSKISYKISQIPTATKYLAGLYIAVLLLGVSWFISITPQQQRDWQPDVSQRLSYQRDANNPDLITLTNVRNFDWYTIHDTTDNSTADNNTAEISATERWETRTIDLSKLAGVDVINSYWMGPLIAHTLVSFRFEDDRPLSFSLEIRKEKGESFSALGGFFKRFELSLIAAEERDIIYTRTNVRGEQVYLFPISHLQQSEVKSLFESYLMAADELNAEPAWYNTLTSNCTNIIFYMARIVSGERLPWDYRIWVSGWLPDYLYEVGMLNAKPEQRNQRWSMEKWYQRAHLNPKVKGFVNKPPTPNDMHNSAAHEREFSKQIRQGIPMPALLDSQAAAEAKAKSTAKTADD